MSVGATPAEVKAFINEWAGDGAEIARRNHLPVSAMLACACTESGFGKGVIFNATKNPFNLQKWERIPIPWTYKNYHRETEVEKKTGKTMVAPFNCATDNADAVRQWCEWILHWGEADGPPQDRDEKVPLVAHPGAIAARKTLLQFRSDPVNFAFNLPLVGFGESKTQELRDRDGGLFRSVLLQNKLTRFD